MKLIAEALPPAAPPAAAMPLPAEAPPAWPLLDALTRSADAAEPREAPRGTLVQLFGGAPPPVPAALPPAPIPAQAPTAGPFPGQWAPHGASHWAPQPPPPAGPPALIPADRVAAPLTELLQGLGRGTPAANPAFGAFRRPGSGAGFR